MRTPSPLLTPRTRLRLRSLANQCGSNAKLSLISSTSLVSSWHDSECDNNPLHSMMSSWSARHISSLYQSEHWTDDGMVDNALFTDEDNQLDHALSSPVNAGGAYYAAGLMMMGPLGDMLAQRIERTIVEIEHRFALLGIKPQTYAPPLESLFLASIVSALHKNAHI